MYTSRDLIDIHTHSTGSRHAYSTVTENISAAQALGLPYYGLSDHAPAMPFTTGGSYFLNLIVIPREWENLTFLRGAECNILNANGDIDLEEPSLSRLDYALAAIHRNCMDPTTPEDHTNAYLKVMDNPHIKVLAHPDDGRFPYDFEAVVRKAIDRKVLLEVNECSLKPDAYRPDAKENLRGLLEVCKKYNAPVILGSDAHFHTDVGKHPLGIKFLEEMDFPEELIVNFHEELIKFFLTGNLTK